MKIHPAGAEFVPCGWTDGQTHGQADIHEKANNSLSQFGNAPKNHRQKHKEHRRNRYNNFNNVSYFDMKELLMAVN